jgi:hypothetical protein
MCWNAGINRMRVEGYGVRGTSTSILWNLQGSVIIGSYQRTYRILLTEAKLSYKLDRRAMSSTPRILPMMLSRNLWMTLTRLQGGKL